jgi:WD40 repeat protein
VDGCDSLPREWILCPLCGSRPETAEPRGTEASVTESERIARANDPDARPAGRWLRGAGLWPVFLGGFVLLVLLPALVWVALVNWRQWAVEQSRLREVEKELAERRDAEERALVQALEAELKARSALNSITEKERAVLEQLAEQSELRRYLKRIEEAALAWSEKNAEKAKISLEACPAELRHWEWHYLRRLCQGEEPRALRGHKGDVSCLAFNADCKLLATGDADGMIKLWDPASGKEIASLPTEQEGPAVLTFRPTAANVLATAGREGSIKLWNTSSAAVTATIQAHKGAVRSLVSSPDGRLLASCGDDGWIRLWDWATTRKARSFQAHEKGVNGLAFSPDGQHLASAGADGNVTVWDVAAGKEEWTGGEHQQSVRGVLFSPDGQRLASWGEDGKVLFWEAKTGKEASSQTKPDQPVSAAAFSPDGKRFLASSPNGTVQLWDAATGRKALALTVTGGAPTSLAVSPDGGLIAVGTAAGKEKPAQVWIWDGRPLPADQPAAPPK